MPKKSKNQVVIEENYGDEYTFINIVSHDKTTDEIVEHVKELFDKVRTVKKPIKEKTDMMTS
tara:strand:- start:202 stop:387 length:186 start_codon:yes stop_codon:yes gene_type:complete